MRSSPADLVLSHALACAPLAPPPLAPVAPSFLAPSAPAAASSAEPLLFPPSAFPYPRLLPGVVFARSHHRLYPTGTRRNTSSSAIPKSLSKFFYEADAVYRNSPGARAPLMFPLGCRIVPGKHLHKYTAAERTS